MIKVILFSFMFFLFSLSAAFCQLNADTVTIARQKEQANQTKLSGGLHASAPDTVVKINPSSVPVLQNRAGEHAPDYNDPDYAAKKAEWIIKYPEEYNKTFQNKDVPNEAAADEQYLKNLGLLKENEPTRYDMELERIKTVRPEVYKKHLEWLKLEDPEPYKIEFLNK